MVPEKWSLGKMVYGKMVPRKMVPGKLVLGKMVPGKLVPEKCPSKIVLRQKNARKFTRLFHFYQLIPLHTHKNVWRIRHDPRYVPNCRTLKESRKICCRVLGFHDARRPPHDFSFLSFSGTIFPPTIFPGTIFPGTIFSGTNFPGTIFPGTIFPGTIFLGTIFPGTNFSGTIFPRTIFPGTIFPGFGPKVCRLVKELTICIIYSECRP